MDRAVREARERTVAWNPRLGTHGGFEWANGHRIQDYPLLIELWAAKLRGRIHVDGGVVRTGKQ